jgi:hypothetical protein
MATNIPIYTGDMPDLASQSQEEISQNMTNFANYINALPTPLNTLASEVEVLEQQTENNATEATTSAASAAQSAASVTTLLDNFDDKYLGAKASDPSVDNEGNPLVLGFLYFNVTDNEMRVYDGSLWISAVTDGGTFHGNVTVNGTVTADDVSVNGTVTASNITDNSGNTYQKDNVLGAVSQSGGVPTGAIIERGSNANGEFVKYADGTLICLCNYSSIYTTDSLQNQIYSSGVFTISLPTSFINNGFVLASTLAPSSGRCWIELLQSNNVNSVSCRLIGNFVTSSAKVRVAAIGRWY